MAKGQAYGPRPGPVQQNRELSELGQWAEREFEALGRQFTNFDTVQQNVLHVEPQRPRDGMIAYADGTNWDPGEGEGVYGYVGGAWTLLSSGGGSGGALVTPSVQTSVQGNPASSVETTLLSYTLPANSVTVIGRGLKINAAGYWGSTSHIATIRLYFGTEVLTITQQATDGSRWTAEFTVILTATGPTKLFVTGTAHAAFLVAPFGSNPTIDMTSSVLIKVTGQGPGAAIANEAVCYQLIVEPLGSDMAVFI